MTDRGTFVMSLDTELAWGLFDIGEAQRERVQQSYERTPEIINQLLFLFDKYEMPVTWAIVAHLLEMCDGPHCEPEPEFGWVDWFDEIPCQSDMDPTYWYMPSLLERIQNAHVEHDIGLHGYTHMILGEPGCSTAAAAAEIHRGVEILKSHGHSPSSFVFPRNSIGYIDELARNDILVYRGPTERWYEKLPMPDFYRKGPRFLEEFCRLTPPAVTPTMREGCVEIPGSQVFRPYHGGWQYTPQGSQRCRAQKGLERAVETGEIFHLWFHPFNLGQHPDQLVSELSEILAYAAVLRSEGKLDVRTMAQIADSYAAGVK